MILCDQRGRVGVFYKNWLKVMQNGPISTFTCVLDQIDNENCAGAVLNNDIIYLGLFINDIIILWWGCNLLGTVHK